MPSIFVRRSLFLILGLSLSACQFQADPGPAVEKQAAVLAERFLMDFDTGDADDALKISGTPFWGDGDVLVNPETFEKELRSEIRGGRNRVDDIELSHVIPFDKLKAVFPRFHRKLSAKFDTQDLYVVFLSVRMKSKGGKARHDNLAILVRNSEKGLKVVGIDD